MHIVTRPRPEILTVKFNGKVFEVTMDNDGAYVPSDLGEYMCQRGLVGCGHNPDPGPQWVMHGNVHGEPIPRFAQWCKEIPESDVDEAATPEAVAAILERKATK